MGASARSKNRAKTAGYVYRVIARSAKSLRWSVSLKSPPKGLVMVVPSHFHTLGCHTVTPPPNGGRMGGGQTQSVYPDEAPHLTSPRWGEELARNTAWSVRELIRTSMWFLQRLGTLSQPVISQEKSPFCRTK